MSNPEDNSKKTNGLSSDPMQRLASLKPPRDLTLGGNKANKKVFTPNLNVARNKNKGLVPSYYIILFRKHFIVIQLNSAGFLFFLNVIAMFLVFISFLSEYIGNHNHRSTLIVIMGISPQYSWGLIIKAL